MRITLSALHTPAEVDALVEALPWARDAVEHGFGAGEPGTVDQGTGAKGWPPQGMPPNGSVAVA